MIVCFNLCIFIWLLGLSVIVHDGVIQDCSICMFVLLYVRYTRLKCTADSASRWPVY